MEVSLGFSQFVHPVHQTVHPQVFPDLTGEQHHGIHSTCANGVPRTTRVHDTPTRKEGPTPEQALPLYVLVIFLFFAFLTILAKQASKRSTLIEIRDSSLKEGRYRTKRVPNVDKSVVFILIVEWLILVVNLTLTGTIFL